MRALHYVGQRGVWLMNPFMRHNDVATAYATSTVASDDNDDYYEGDGP